MHIKITAKSFVALLLSLSLALPSTALTSTDSDEAFSRYLSEREKAYSELLPRSNANVTADDDTVLRINGGKNGTASLPSEKSGKTLRIISNFVTVAPNITRLEIPESYIAIISQSGNSLDTRGAFYENKTLKTVIPSRNLKYIGNKAFYGASSLEYFFLPYLTSHIGSYAFAYCTSLKGFSVYGSTAIGDGAFAGCTNLSRVYLSDRVTRIGLGAFEHTPFYDSLRDEFCIVNGNLIKYNGKGGDIVIPEGTRLIADGVFAGRLSIRSVSLPSTLRYIGNSAFRSCAGLKEIYIEEDGAAIAVGENAFDGCTSLSDDSLLKISSLEVSKRDLTVYLENKEILDKSPISFISLVRKAVKLEIRETENENTEETPSPAVPVITLIPNSPTESFARLQGTTPYPLSTPKIG